VVHVSIRISRPFAHCDSELALQLIEAQNSISLSRTLGTPNILSKGVLEQRAISVPATLFPPGHHHRALLDSSSAKKLIEEVADIPAAVSTPDHVRPRDPIMLHSNGASETPSWTWGQESGEIRITIQVPKLVGNKLLRCDTVPDGSLDLRYHFVCDP
jgi:hypothetical protein